MSNESGFRIAMKEIKIWYATNVFFCKYTEQQILYMFVRDENHHIQKVFFHKYNEQQM